MRDDRRLILVDALDVSDIDREFIESLGHDVTTCAGPQGGTCPLVEGGRCELAEKADGVVFMLDLDQLQHREVLAAYRDLLREDLPIGVVVRDRFQALEHAALLRGLRVWTHLPGVGDLDALVAQVDAVEV